MQELGQRQLKCKILGSGIHSCTDPAAWFGTVSDAAPISVRTKKETARLLSRRARSAGARASRTIIRVRPNLNGKWRWR
jgi:hypothetical protein